MAAGKKSSVILWTGLAAAATGIVVVAVFVNLKERSRAEGSVSNRLRDVQDVLTDCYKKITEIEQHLPELVQSSPKNNTHPSQPFQFLILNPDSNHQTAEKEIVQELRPLSTSVLGLFLLLLALYDSMCLHSRANRIEHGIRQTRYTCACFRYAEITQNKETLEPTDRIWIDQ